MADITWPVGGGKAFWPAQHDEELEHNVELVVKRNGGIETMAIPGALWKGTLRFDTTSVANLIERRQLEAFLLDLEGGAHRLLLWNLATPMPLGTARATASLAAAVAVGAKTASLQGVLTSAPNVLANPSFEVLASGLRPAGYDYYDNGASTTQFLRPAGRTAGYAFGLGLVSGSTTAFGLKSSFDVVSGQDVAGRVPGGWQPFGRYVVSWWAKKVAGAGFAGMRLAWNVAPQSTAVLSNPALTTSWQRYAMLITWGAAVETSVGGLFVSVDGLAAAGDAIHIDDLMVQDGDTLADYPTTLPTLLRGDRISIGNNQRVVLTADAQADAAGNMSVSFKPACRVAVAANTPVALVRPMARFVVTSASVPMLAAGTELPGFGISLVEDATP
jgi:hypothetical protein